MVWTRKRNLARLPRWFAGLYFYFGATLLLMFAIIEDAHATSCAEPKFATSLESASVVFSGRVIIEMTSPTSTLVQIAVEKVWKGDVPATVRVRGGGLMGTSFINGEHYLVFANQREWDPTLLADLCGGTSPTNRVADWIAQLGEGRPPASGSGSPSKAPTPTAPSIERPSTEPPASAPLPLNTTARGPSTSALPAPGGGCAGCVVAGARPSDATWWLALAALLASGARRGSREGR